MKLVCDKCQEEYDSDKIFPCVCKLCETVLGSLCMDCVQDYWQHEIAMGEEE